MRLFALMLSAVAVGTMSYGCTPKAPPLRGTVAPSRLPAIELPPVHRKIVFRWTYRDVNYTFKGEGVARVSPPDSVRLDFFLDNGIGGGYATLVGDDISAPGPDFVRSLLPPAPMLWAALGRLAVPAAADTAVRIDGDTTRADIGKDPRWRVALVNRDIRAVDLIHGENLEQSLSRTASGDVRYEHRTAHRLLELNITRVDTTSAFDSAIWH